MKYRSVIYTFILWRLFMWLSTAFAVNCKQQVPDPVENEGHSYTCEIKPASGKTNFCEEGVFQDEWQDWVPWCNSPAVCHICKKIPTTEDSGPVPPPQNQTQQEKTCNTAKWEEKIGEKCVCVPKPWICCGIKLNTNVPFIGNCITVLSKEKQALIADKMQLDANTTLVTGDEAFPRLMLWLTKILITVILLGSFIAIIVAGVMIAASWGSDGSATKGRQLIGSVVVALALLGASGVILRLINPNFFG